MVRYSKREDCKQYLAAIEERARRRHLRTIELLRDKVAKERRAKVEAARREKKEHEKYMKAQRKLEMKAENERQLAKQKKKLNKEIRMRPAKIARKKVEKQEIRDAAKSAYMFQKGKKKVNEFLQKKIVGGHVEKMAKMAQMSKQFREADVRSGYRKK